MQVKKKCFPNAIVELVEPFCCHQPNAFADYALGGDGGKPKTKDDVTKFLSSRKNKAPLLELLPTCEQPSSSKKKNGSDAAETEDLDDDEDEDDDDEDESTIDIEEIAEILELYRLVYKYNSNTSLLV